MWRAHTCVDVGTDSALLIISFCICCAVAASACIRLQLSAAYVRLGMMHVSTIWSVAARGIMLRTASLVARAALTSFALYAKCSFKEQSLEITSPKYRYDVQVSSCTGPNFQLNSLLSSLTGITLHLLAPNLTWYFMAWWCIVSSICCNSIGESANNVISSINRRAGIDMCPCLVPLLLLVRISHMSSTILAYSITDKTPPCLMLSVIVMILVSPYLVLILAVTSVLSSLRILQRLPLIPDVHSVYVVYIIQSIIHFQL